MIGTLDLLLIVPHYSHQVERPLKSKPRDGEKVRDEGGNDEQRRVLSRGSWNPVAKARGRCEGGVNPQQPHPELVFQSAVGLICDNGSERHGVTPG